MALDPTYLALFLTPALTGIAVAMCITRALSDHFYRRKHLVPPEQVERRAALRARRAKRPLRGLVKRCFAAS